jgi:glycosyltransferase involved in cell wall biosynthesis
MGNNLRFHIHGLHHTQTNKYFNSCAFTMQIHAMCDMLTKVGYEVYHYGNEGSDPNCTENITIASEKERYGAFPFADYRHAPPRLSGKHANTGYLAAPEFCDEWDKRTIKEIKKRIRPNDFILNFCNTEYMNISSAFEDTAILVEPGIGYAGGCPNTRKVYVSHTWQAFHDGWNARGITDNTDEDCYFGKPEIQDAVIHYFVDEEDFEYSEDKKNYAFFIGRFNEDKGVTIALHTCAQYRKETGDKSFKLKMAGPGSDWFVDLLTEDQKEWVEVLGFVEPDEKKKLLREAKVLFAPSLYNEPFGAISIEAQISGTPVISTDWGGFPESVIHGKTGYRCRNFEHFVWALKNIDKINSKDCYTWASNNFTKKAMTPKYIDYFEGLYRIRTNDTYWWTLDKDRRSLDTCQMN